MAAGGIFLRDPYLHLRKVKKNLDNSERLGRRARHSFESSIFSLPDLRAESLSRWCAV